MCRTTVATDVLAGVFIHTYSFTALKKKGLSVAIGVASPDENGELKIELGNSVAAAGQGDEGTEFSESVRNK